MKSTKPLVDPPLQPSNIEAEESLLGSLMIDRAAITCVEPFLKPEDFYRGRNGAIYAAMLALYRQSEPADFITLTAELKRVGKLEDVGGASYLIEVTNASPTSAHAEHYARIVAKHAVYRRMIQAGTNIVAMAYEQPDDPDAAITRAEAMLYELRETRHSGKLISPRERADRALVRYSDLQEGVMGNGTPFGFLDLDGITGGAHPGELIIVAGRTSMGKTALMQDIAENMATVGRNVLMCSAEMPEWQLTDRSLAARVRQSTQTLQQGPFSDALWAGISEHLGQLAEESLWVYDDPDMTTNGIRATATEMRSRVGLDVLIVDYLQLLHDRHGVNENERVGRMSRELKALARGLGVPVICGSQLNRECENRANKRPQLSDIRDSGSVEQDADVVMLLHRDAYYWTEQEWARMHGAKPYPKNVTEVIIAKQRNGPRGKAIYLVFVDQLTQFKDFAGDYGPMP